MTLKVARKPGTALHHPGQASCNTESMACIRNMLGRLTCGAGVAAVLIAITGTVSAHGTQTVSAVAASESAAANQAAAHANAVALLGEVSLPAGATESSSEPAGDEGLLAHAGAGGLATPNVVEAHAWWTVPGSRAEVMAYVREVLRGRAAHDRWTTAGAAWKRSSPRNEHDTRTLAGPPHRPCVGRQAEDLNQRTSETIETADYEPG